MINEHEQVILRTSLPEYSLLPGDIGTVVHIYKDGGSYEIELFTVDGETLDIITVDANHIRSVDSHAIFHARPMAA